ncbi:unnamed protein product [Prunus armeniaca]
MASSLKVHGLLGLITIRLNDDNFMKWRYQIESVLEGHELFGHFDGSVVPPPKFAFVDEEATTSEVTVAYKNWLKLDKALLSLLIATLSNDAIEYVIGSKTAQLQTAQKGADSIEKFMLRLKHVRDQLALAGVSISDDDLMISVLNGLPFDYDMIRTVLVAHATPISLKDFCSQFLAAEQATESRPSSLLSPMTAMIGHSSSVSPSPGAGILPTPYPNNCPTNCGGYFAPRPSSGFPRSGITPECQICFECGHTAVNCFYRNSSSTSSSSSSVVECQICGKRGHGALNCYHRSNYVYQGSPPPPTLNAMTAQVSYAPETMWIADSGASHHMLSNVNTLESAQPCASENRVTVGNREGLPVDHIGHASISSSSSILHMSNVFHDKVTKQVLLTGRSHSGLYLIPGVAASSSPPTKAATNEVAYLGQQVKFSLWHSRLGHPTNEVVHSMLKSASLPPIVDSHPHICQYCLSGKMHSLPFPTHHNKAVTPFHRIHSDVWGPSPCKSFQGCRYIVTFIDEFIGFSWIYPMFAKSEVFSHFMKFHDFVVNQFLADIKYFHSDRGGEYVSNRFHEFLGSKGIVHQFSCPSKAQQNGLAERKNRHLVETAITLLSEASLPQHFWFHVISHSIYLINHMPSKVLDHKSPYFRLFHQHPDIQHLRIFGTAVYPCLRSINQNKLQARTTLCVFLGYLMGYKGILCFNMSTSKLLVSRDVVHDEIMFPFKQGVPVLGSSSSSVASTSSAPISVVLPILSHADVPPPLSDPPATPHVPIASVSSPSGPSTSHFSSPSAVHDQEPIPTILPALTNQQLDVLFPSLDSSSASDISPTNHHSMQTRSKSGVTKRKDFADYECYHTSLLAMPKLDEPSRYRVARYSPEWVNAMQEEISALNTQGTWTLVPPPPGVNIVGSKWIYKVKRNSDGSVSRYKARLVAQGFSQTQGFDYSETFSPVVRHMTVQLILSLAAMHGWQLRQLDVKNTFLHGDLEEEVYMKQPQGFEDSTHPQYVCKLRKSLYGLKQAPRAWNAKFTGHLPAIGFKASQSDPSLFVKKEGSEIVILLLYVDDIILTGSSTSLVQTTNEELSSVFEMKDMGQLTYFLGLQISYLSTGSIFVSQQKYAKELLAKAGMTTCKACSTPCKPYTQVLQTEGEPLKDPSLYRSIVGAL